MADLSGIPECGLACLISSFPATSCATTNTTCLCLDPVYESVVASCVTQNCTVRESLLVKNGTYSACGAPEYNGGASLIAITAVLISLQTLFFALRMICRAVRIAPWGWDDTTIVVAFAVTTSFAGAAALESRVGFGRNVWTVAPDDIDMFLKIFYAFEALYVFVLAVIKISICFLYLRIFPSHRFRVAVWATQVFNVALVIAFEVTDGLQCRPISFFWQGWDGEHEGSCWNLEAYVYSHAAFNILLDVWMLALPASQIWHLNLSMKKKAGVSAMFGFGILLTLVSIIRLVSLKDFARTLNPTADFYRVGIWTAVEITAGIMVACMPAARLLVMHLIARVSTATHPRTASLSEPYRARSGNSMNNGTGAAARTLSKRSPNRSLAKSLSPKDLDKNRDYSMSVTVTSDKDLSLFESDDLQLAEEGSAGIKLDELPGSAKSSPSREQFRLSELYSTAGENHRERPRRILVTQDVSVSTGSSRSPRHEIQDGVDSQGGI